MKPNQTPTTCTVDLLYTKYQHNVKQYFLKYTHDEMKAEDMTHDLFVKLICRHEVIMPQTALALLFTIASRMIISDARRIAIARKVIGNCQYVDCYEDSSLDCKEIERLEQERVGQLPPKMRAVYMASRFEGKTADELALAMSVNKRTIESHLFVARRAVREYVRQAIAAG